MLIASNNIINALKVARNTKKTKSKENKETEDSKTEKKPLASVAKKNTSLPPIAITIISFISILITIVFFTGINLGFNDVYELRSNFLETKIPSVLLYVFSAIKVINPLFYVYFYKNNKFFWCSATIIIQILAFLCDGSKSTLFSLIIVIFLALKVKKSEHKSKIVLNDNVKTYLIWGLAIINFAGFVEFKVFNSAFIYNYFIRRLFFVPARLHEKYYLFFNENPVDLFRQSILRRVGFASPYEKPIQKMIGARFFNDPNLIANNGLFSDAYMNFGGYGVIIMPILLALAFSFLDICASNTEIIYLITPIISTSYVFISSSFFTALATHGYLITCIIIKMLSSKEVDNGKN